MCAEERTDKRSPRKTPISFEGNPWWLKTRRSAALVQYYSYKVLPVLGG